MKDSRLSNLASLLVNYSVEVKPADWVVIQGNCVALPLVNEVLAATLKAGGNPVILLASDELNRIRMEESSEEQLRWISPFDQLAVDKADAIIHVRAAENTRSLTGIDPIKTRWEESARSELFQKYMDRTAEGGLRWVVTQYPCPAYAQEADMSLGEFEDFVYAATFADQPDPVRLWQETEQRQQRLVDWLKGKQNVEVRGANCDLHLSIAERTFINSAGRYNMPCGEIFTGPVEDSVNGWVRFTYPAITGGREVDGVELEFKEGKVVRAAAKKNEEFLISKLDTDSGARYLGEFAIGTNYAIRRFTKSILFDEKIGGTIHMAVGAGYPETGSLNRSSIHWDFICDMRDGSEILVDGELFYRNGEFVI